MANTFLPLRLATHSVVVRHMPRVIENYTRTVTFAADDADAAEILTAAYADGAAGNALEAGGAAIGVMPELPDFAERLPTVMVRLGVPMLAVPGMGGYLLLFDIFTLRGFTTLRPLGAVNGLAQTYWAQAPHETCLSADNVARLREQVRGTFGRTAKVGRVDLALACKLLNRVPRERLGTAPHAA